MKRVRRLYSHPAIAGFAHILGGAMGAQVITFAALPVLSRLYTPDAFGLFTLVLALAALVTPVITLRLETAAMLPVRIEEVRALVWNAALSVVFFSLIYALILYSVRTFGIGDLPAYPGFPLWVAGLALLGGTFVLLSQLALRKQEYSLVGRRTLLRAAATSLTQVSLGVLRIGPFGLFFGAACGSIFGIATIARRTREFWVFPGFRELANAWKKYWRFPVFFAPSALLNSLGLQFPLIFFTLWFGVTSGGQLGMAERIIGVPLALVGAAVGQMIDAEVSKRIRDKHSNLFSFFVKTSLALGLLGIIIGIAFASLGPSVIPWILGDQWRTAGMFVQVLAITGAVRLVVNPLSKFLLLLQKSFANMVLDIFRVAAVLVTILVSVRLSLDLIESLWLVYSSLTLTYVVTWIYCAVIIHNNDR